MAFLHSSIRFFITCQLTVQNSDFLLLYNRMFFGTCFTNYSLGTLGNV